MVSSIKFILLEGTFLKHQTNMSKLNLILILFNLWLGQPEESNKFQIGVFVGDGITDMQLKFAIGEYKKYYNVEVHRIRKFELPNQFKKDTINAIRLITYLQNNELLPYDKHIYLTDQGIALMDNAKYSTRGLAKMGSNIAVISTLIISNESSNKKQFKQLFSKVLIHEMAHLFGLGHCEIDQRCVMVSSLPNPQNFYNAKNILCYSCLNKINKKLIKRKYHNPKL